MTPPAPYDVAIIGAGIVGLATALELASKHPRHKIIVLEKEQDVGMHQTSHNSGVIHSGIYYRPGSQKAALCVSGAEALQAFCQENGVRYNTVGKVVVATSEMEIPALDALYKRGIVNGVKGLQMIGPARLREIEPHAYGVRAIWSPHTAIVDYRQVARAYARNAENAGAEIVTGAKVVKITRMDGGVHIDTTRGVIHTAHLVNCAGLYADVIARMTGASPDVRIIPFRGEYHTLAPHREHLVRGLIYPVPDPQFPFLGVHFTRVVGGGVEAGPNAVLAFAREGYRKSTLRFPDLLSTLGYTGFWSMSRRHWRTGIMEFRHSFSRRSFARALQKLVPDIRESDLEVGGAGVRAQAVDKRGALLDDFSVLQTAECIHVLNAPSPAATSSLSLGRHIAAMAAKAFDLSR